MSGSERKTVHIPEICRVEGHEAVTVEIAGGKVESVQLEVFEGTRFFEKIVLGHHFSEMPHITSRVCAICSTGHVLAAINGAERSLKFKPSLTTSLYRELMHLGMIIESHATHVYALALPDFVGAPDLYKFATEHADMFAAWTRLRNLGALIQTIVGGRPFHPVNLQVGGLSHYPTVDELAPISAGLEEHFQLPVDICTFLMKIKPAVERTTSPSFLALIPEGKAYGYFGERVRSSDGFEESIDNYKEYLAEHSVPYSHAKRSPGKGKPLMVGSMARLHFYSDRLSDVARGIYARSPLAAGDTNTIWNNLAQAIEIVEAFERSKEIIRLLKQDNLVAKGHDSTKLSPRAGRSAGAVECPRGTLYHYYELDEKGVIRAADMITPSAQNTARIELDIREVVDQATDPTSPQLQANLETLIRAYDPCNTCATHMVSVRYR